jgi:hypothetical protein
MLKRYQVLLNDWLVDYIKGFAERYDLSFSEIIRIMLCLQSGAWITSVYPNYKLKINLKEIEKELRTLDKKKTSQEDEHKLASTIYFEARKAIDFFLAQQEKKRRNKKG